jgi:hypothetical protein
MMPLIALLLMLAAPQPALPEGVGVSVHVDPPAMWVADRVTYTVEIACPPGVDIVADDLDRSRLALNGLDLLSADTQRRQEGGAVRYVFEYVLTTYRVDVASPSVGPVKVRYFLARPGQRAQDAAPAGTITVPATTIPFRSLLPDDQTASQVREGGAIPPRWWPYRALGVVGIGLILISIVPAALLVGKTVHAARRRRKAERRPSARRARQAMRDAFDGIRAADASDVRARREGLARLEALVRGHLATAVGPELAALTADEIRAMPANGHSHITWDRVTSLLESCEIARFAGLETRPSADEWRQALDDAAVLVGAAPDGR